MSLAGSALRAKAPQGRYVDQLCLQARRMRCIPRLGIASKGDPEQLLAEFCAEAPSLFRADGVAVFFDDGQGAMRVHAASGFGEAFVRWASFSTAEMTTLAERDGDVSILQGGPENWAPEQAVQAGMASAMWAAVRCGGRIGGGLLIGQHAGGFAFSDDDRLYAEVLAEYLGARVMELRLQKTITRLQGAILRAAKLAMVGELAWALAHEINYPVAAILDRAERSLAMVPPESPLRPHQETIHRESRRISTMVDSLLAFARRDGSHKQPVLLSDIIDAVLNLIGWQLARDGIRVEVSWEDGLPPVPCRARDIEQVMINLVSNARQALNARFPEGGDAKELRIEGRRAMHHGTTYAEIEVWDAGIGIPAAHQPGLFELLADRAGDGIGLGLAVCRDVLREHEGSVHLESEEGTFTRVVISLPLEESP